MLLHGTAILFFTRGFLLTRSELSQYSQCDDIFESPCFPPTTTSIGCWTEPSVDRLVILVLDALRFDLSSFFKKPWMDKLDVLLELASQNRSRAKIFKAVADPPTTSLQRLKGLTTGGLPTFIDVGNSFGAPEIVEDSWIHQLVRNGKRVVMMGDDTWVQLFPDHFIRSHPFPSFNVKDLHTVDNGCIENLIPSLHEKDWDVLIAHFLGMDHAGHIFGVDSSPMIEKLEQYNSMIKEVVGVLEGQSGPGGLHENTMLLVMGDHGQTLNGDHGGGTAEEVETALFALSLKQLLSPQLSEADSLNCRIDETRGQICIGSIQQLDFAATVCAMLGIPFPFGSIGRVNPELYSLATGSRNYKVVSTASDQNRAGVDKWTEEYANVLCINSWQVKKYIDAYSSMSLIGFSDKDLWRLSDLYSKADDLWSATAKDKSYHMSHGSSESSALAKMQVNAFSLFLESVAELARSNWTEFNLKMMGIGFFIMLGSLYLYLSINNRLEKHFTQGRGMNLFVVTLAGLMVLIRSFSLLSNSFILEEGRVASFLLATTALLQLRIAISKKTVILEGLLLCALICLLKFSIELGQLKQAVNSLFLKIDPSKNPGIAVNSLFWIYSSEVAQISALMILVSVLYSFIIYHSSRGIPKYIVMIALLNFLLILAFWASDSPISLGIELLAGTLKGNLVPRITYAAGVLQLSLLVISECIIRKRSVISGDPPLDPRVKALAMVSAWSPTILILSGKQGSLSLLALLIGGWCISRLMALAPDSNDDFSRYVLPVTQWSLVSVCMFFSSGHWCGFDGLRYAAAFVGFDEFHLFRQATLLTIDTFGLSLILPVFGLPLVLIGAPCYERTVRLWQLFPFLVVQGYVMYGFIWAVSATFTMLCVWIQRRHLMVWGVFAPKFVFDVVGLLLTDLTIFLSALFYV
ncbi:hypothetical protein M569_04617, partial [Genlisea aurea]